jgi:hypothetical protein
VGLRERVRDSIETPVAEATKLLAESKGADLETRLAMIIDGWGRGLAGALEELAVELDELRASRRQPDERPGRSSKSDAQAGERESEQDDAGDDEPGPSDEQALQQRAAASREATKEMREARATRD